jgi:hypothetical protein
MGTAILAPFSGAADPECQPGSHQAGVSHHGSDVFLHGGDSGKQGRRLTLASHEIFDALQDYRRATFALAAFDIGKGVPVYGMNTIVELAFLVFSNEVRGISDPQELLARLRMYP